MNNIPSIDISGIKVNIVQIPQIIEIASKWIERKDFGNYIVVSNTNDVITGRRDRKVKEAVNKSSLSIPDGISLVILARLQGYPLKSRAYGPDLMLEFLKVSEKKGYSHFFYGGRENTLKKLILNIQEKFPKIKIVGSYSPPFKDSSGEYWQVEVIDKINRAAPDILWVGLGCPKQQLWMYEYKDDLQVPVMVGVGAAFDFLAGTKPQAPKWLRDNGFEWLFRLITEPKRLWRRYLIGNSLFLYFFLKEFIKRRILKKV